MAQTTVQNCRKPFVFQSEIFGFMCHTDQDMVDALILRKTADKAILHKCNHHGGK